MKKTSPELPLCGHFNQFIKVSINGRRLTASGKRITKGTIVNYQFFGGGSDFVVKDKKMLQRLELLEKIDDDDRETILKVVDNYLTTAQLQTTTKKLKQKA